MGSRRRQGFVYAASHVRKMARYHRAMTRRFLSLPASTFAALPNALSALRAGLGLALLAPFLLLDPPTADRVALAMLTFGALTDAADGWLARRWRVVTAFGAALDPVADKLLVLGALLALGLFRIGPALWFLAPAIAIVAREALVVTLRARARKRLGRANAVPVSTVSKWKTAAQIGALTLLFAAGAGLGASGALMALGGAVLWLAAALGLWSAAAYVSRA